MKQNDSKAGSDHWREKMTISSLRSLRCVMNKSGVGQVRQISAQAVKVESSGSDCVKTSDRQQQQQQEDFQNYLYVKSSLDEVYKIDLDARSEFYLKQ